MLKRILVTGSRKWDDEMTIRRALYAGLVVGEPGLEEAEAHPPTLVHGGARGADSIAAKIWANDWGLPVEEHLADWNKHGRRAGYIRNKEMVDRGADMCLAFIKDNSPGATMTATLAEQAGIPTMRFNGPYQVEDEPYEIESLKPFWRDG